MSLMFIFPFNTGGNSAPAQSNGVPNTGYQPPPAYNNTFCGNNGCPPPANTFNSLGAAPLPPMSQQNLFQKIGQVVVELVKALQNALTGNLFQSPAPAAPLPNAGAAQAQNSLKDHFKQALKELINEQK